MKKKNIIILALASVFLLVFIVWMIWGNIAVTVNEYEIECERLPDEFNGFRIAQISDLHNEEIGKDNSGLVEKLKKASPDIIVITGDLVDCRRTDVDVALSFIGKICDIAPVYYVSGNHEYALTAGEYTKLYDGLTNAGVTILENSATLIEKNGKYISLVGLSDQSFGDVLSNDDLVALMGDKTDFSILLTHRPRDFEQYAACGYDLIFSGHLHGGQFRLPFLGGLYAPSYGFFPEYDGGIYEKEGSVMIVSRGLGNSRFPIRFNNPREIVIVEIVKK